MNADYQRFAERAVKALEVDVIISSPEKRALAYSTLALAAATQQQAEETKLLRKSMADLRLSIARSGR